MPTRTFAPPHRRTVDKAERRMVGTNEDIEMPKTKTRWFSWLAQHAKYVFSGVCGAGAGAFGALVCGAAGIRADSVYLAVLTAMMGGVVGFVSAIAMDLLADRRKKRHKAYMARLRIRPLRDTWIEMLDLARAVTSEGTIKIVTKGQVPTELADYCVALGIRLRNIARDAPDFDGIVESDADLYRANMVDAEFRYVINRFHVAEWSLSTPTRYRRAAVANFVSEDPVRSIRGTLQALDFADRHFAQRYDARGK
jgi:hypothetical protein